MATLNKPCAKKSSVSLWKALFRCTPAPPWWRWWCCCGPRLGGGDAAWVSATLPWGVTARYRDGGGLRDYHGRVRSPSFGGRTTAGGGRGRRPRQEILADAAAGDSLFLTADYPPFSVFSSSARTWRLQPWRTRPCHGGAALLVTHSGAGDAGVRTVCRDWSRASSAGHRPRHCPGGGLGVVPR